MLNEIMRFLSNVDAEVGGAVAREYARQQRNIELIASENIASEAVVLAAATVLTNKYAEGTPGKRYYGGCEYVDEVERMAQSRACELFGAEHANVQPHSGAQANAAVFHALLKPGDRVLGMKLAHGGHLTHGTAVNFSGRYFESFTYGVDDNTGLIDYDEVERIANECKPQLIVAGASAYPRIIDFERFSKIAKSVGAYLMVDMAHIAGLVAAGEHPSPIPYADVVTTTTHKTLRGPRGGLILCGKQYAKAIDKAVFPGIQGGPLMHIIAAKAICFGEALGSSFKEYQHQVVLNARTLAAELKNRGFELASGGTDNHLMLVDLRPFGLTGKEFEERLDSLHITANKNAIPGDPQKPSITSGIRVGTPAVTSRGFREAEMVKIAELIQLAAQDYEGNSDRILREVAGLCEKYPVYGG